MDSATGGMNSTNGDASSILRPELATNVRSLATNDVILPNGRQLAVLSNYHPFHGRWWQAAVINWLTRTVTEPADIAATSRRPTRAAATGRAWSEVEQHETPRDRTVATRQVSCNVLQSPDHPTGRDPSDTG